MSCGGSCGCCSNEKKKIKKDDTACCGGECGMCDECECQRNEETQACRCGESCAYQDEACCDDESQEGGCCGGGCGCADGGGVMISEEDFAALQAILGRFEEDEEPSEEAMAEVEEILKKYKS